MVEEDGSVLVAVIGKRPVQMRARVHPGAEVELKDVVVPGPGGEAEGKCGSEGDGWLEENASVGSHERPGIVAGEDVFSPRGAVVEVQVGSPKVVPERDKTEEFRGSGA